MQYTTELNSLAFITQSGPVILMVAIILLLMSVASWTVVVVKTIQMMKVKKSIKKDVDAFWAAPGVDTLLERLQPASATSQLALIAVESSVHHKAHKSTEACSHEEFVARSLRRELTQQLAQLESGLTVLASVGSVAPFVGLFGTVWGIYHALANISASGQATLDKVAGPVGEALIMTAIGLAVAIPAVLAYNAFVKANRNCMASLESFAQDVHILLTTGAPFLAKQTTEKKAVETTSPLTSLNEVPA